MKTELNWEVSKNNVQILDLNGSPLISDGKPLVSTKHNAIIRSDNNSILSIKSKSYSPPSIAEFKERANEIHEITGFELMEFEELNGGATVLAYFKNTKKNFEIAGHKMQRYMVIGNSYNGLTSFFVGSSDIYLRCTNAFSYLHKAMKVRNSKNSKQRRDTLMREIEIYYNGSKKLHTMYNRFGDRIVSNDLKQDIALKVLGLEDKEEIGTNMQNKLNQLMANIHSECSELGDNLWGVFNGITWYTSHEMNSKTQLENQVTGNIFGKRAAINKKGFDVCSNLITV